MTPADAERIAQIEARVKRQAELENEFQALRNFDRQFMHFREHELEVKALDRELLGDIRYLLAQLREARAALARRDEMPF